MSADVGADVFTILDKLGFTNYVIPFILIWTALYAVLMKLKIIGDNASLNGMIAFTIAYLVIAFGGGAMIATLLPFFIVFFLILLIILLLFSFIGIPNASIVTAFKNPGVILIIIGLITLLTFVALQDWLIFADRIPSWKVNSSGDIIVNNSFSGEYPVNISSSVNESKPNRIIVNGIEYDLINGMYYKQGYEGSAYALGNPQVIASIFIFVILAIVTALIVWPKFE